MYSPNYFIPACVKNSSAPVFSLIELPTAIDGMEVQNINFTRIRKHKTSYTKSNGEESFSVKNFKLSQHIPFYSVFT